MKLRMEKICKVTWQNTKFTVGQSGQWMIKQDNGPQWTTKHTMYNFWETSVMSSIFKNRKLSYMVGQNKEWSNKLISPLTVSDSLFHMIQEMTGIPYTIALIIWICSCLSIEALRTHTRCWTSTSERMTRRTFTDMLIESRCITNRCNF